MKVEVCLLFGMEVSVVFSNLVTNLGRYKLDFTLIKSVLFFRGKSVFSFRRPGPGSEPEQHKACSRPTYGAFSSGVRALSLSAVATTGRSPPPHARRQAFIEIFAGDEHPLGLLTPSLPLLLLLLRNRAPKP